MTGVPVAFIPSPPTNGFYLGPLFVHAYGLAYVVAVIAAVAITVRRWETKGGDRDLVYEPWFVRIQRAGVKRSAGKTMRRGGALLAAGGLLALTGCGQASHTSAVRSQADGHPEQWMPGRPARL